MGYNEYNVRRTIAHAINLIRTTILNNPDRKTEFINMIKLLIKQLESEE